MEKYKLKINRNFNFFFAQIFQPFHNLILNINYNYYLSSFHLFYKGNYLISFQGNIN
jgi:hypothetical protein